MGDPALGFTEQCLERRTSEEIQAGEALVKVMVVEAESDDDEVDLSAGHHIIREAIKMIRDRRHEGYDDKLRVQRRIGRRKVKPIRQRTKRGRREEYPEDDADGIGKGKAPSSSSSHSQVRTPPQYIEPGCTRMPMVLPDRPAPSPPSLTGTPFVTSARGLLAQLREIEMHPPAHVESVDVPMGSPTSSHHGLSPQREAAGEGRKSWNGGLIQRQYVELMEYTHSTSLLEEPSQITLNPYDMRDQSYLRMSESP